MKKHLFTISILSVLLLATGCKQTEEKVRHIPTAPQMKARIDRSEPVKTVDVEQAAENPVPLKLSQIASEIEYYTVGDARFTVTQAIELPDSGAFITFNNPRIYYRKQGIPSKRYGFKALAYKWNNEMNGQNMFYDKKTTRMYVALSGKTQETRSFAAIGHDADNQKLLLPRKPHREIPARPAWRQVARLFLHRLHFVQLQRNGGRTGRNHDIQPPRRYTLQVPVERREIGPAHDDGQYSVLSNILLEHRTRQDDIHDPLL